MKRYAKWVVGFLALAIVVGLVADRGSRTETAGGGGAVGGGGAKQADDHRRGDLLGAEQANRRPRPGAPRGAGERRSRRRIRHRIGAPH